MTEFAWTEEATAVVRERYGKPQWSAAKIAASLGTSLNSVQKKAKRMNLCLALDHTRSTWTPEATEFVRTHYTDPEWTAAKIGDHLGLKRGAVIGKAKRLGLCGPARIKKPKDHPSRVAKKRRQFNFDSFNPPPKLRREAVQRVKPTLGRMEGYAALGTSVEGCKWPGVAAGEVQCVAQAVKTLPYCPEHCCRAYVVPVRR